VSGGCPKSTTTQLQRRVERRIRLTTRVGFRSIFQIHSITYLWPFIPLLHTDHLHYGDAIFHLSFQMSHTITSERVSSATCAWTRSSTLGQTVPKWRGRSVLWELYSSARSWPRTWSPLTCIRPGRGGQRGRRWTGRRRQR
jgi:hypothetical protein